MRYAAALAVALGLSAWASTAHAQVPWPTPGPGIGFHQPYVVYTRMEYCGPYGLYGPHDLFPCFPPNGIQPPPFGPSWWFTGRAPAAAGANARPAFRSPRDYFMMRP
jgi:hypothetical protein